MKPFFVTIPHSGEQVPAEATWLQGLPERLLMCDVDRFVDRLYRPGLTELKIPHLVADCHRYAVDLNRLAEDVDQDSVAGSLNPSGTFPTGLHWVKTTLGEPLMNEPIHQRLHRTLVEKYFEAFHQRIREKYQSFFSRGFRKVFHLDAHSMPSMGTAAHRDPGQLRPEIVVSDFHGASCAGDYKDLVIQAFERAGFKVAYNFPYVGGRLTQTYGQPQRGQHAIQVELRRNLYMDEVSKQLLPEHATIQDRIKVALAWILEKLPQEVDA